VKLLRRDPAPDEGRVWLRGAQPEDRELLRVVEVADGKSVAAARLEPPQPPERSPRVDCVRREAMEPEVDAHFVEPGQVA